MKTITLIAMCLLCITGYAQLSEDFSNNDMPKGWVAFEGENELGTRRQWAFKDEYAFIRSENVSGGLAEDWLVTNKVAITDTAFKLNFDETDAGPNALGSTLSVRVSTNSQTTYSDFTSVLELTESNTGNFTTREIDLTAYIGQEIYIAFVMANDRGDSWAIDNVKLIENETTGNAPLAVSNPTPADTATDISFNTNNAVNLSWVAATEGDLATSFNVYFGNSADNLELLGSTTETNYNVLDLEHNTQYFWQIVAVNDNGDSTDNAIWSFTTIADTRVPLAVSNPNPSNGATDVVFNIDNNTIDVSWSASEEGNLATSFVVYFGESADNLALVEATSSTSTSLSNINFNTQYFWQVVAVNDNGSSVDNTIWSFTTTNDTRLPMAVRNPNHADGAKDITFNTDNNTINISWEASSEGNPATRFEVYTGDNANNLTLIETTSDTETMLPNIDFNTQYFWKVVAVNDNGSSIDNATWSFTTFEDKSLSNIDNNLDTFTVWPNPTTNFINIKTNLSIDAIYVFDQLGKQVIVDRNIMDNRINLSQLNNGVYIVKIVSGNQVATKQIVKN